MNQMITGDDSDLLYRLQEDIGRAARYIRISALVALGWVSAGVGCVSTTGCDAFRAQNAANTLLNAADITCVLLAPMADSQTVMNLCRLQPTVRNAVDQLLAGKAGAQRSGMHFEADAGVPAKWGY